MKATIIIYNRDGSVTRSTFESAFGCVEVGSNPLNGDLLIGDHNGYCHGDDCDEWYDDIMALDRNKVHMISVCINGHSKTLAMSSDMAIMFKDFNGHIF